MVNKVDSNVTGLRFAEESDTIGVLPGSPVWRPLEPNGYTDFGGQITTVARNPINPSRQRKKGVTTDLDASGGFGTDFTQTNMTRLLQGFFFADRREKPTTLPMNSAQQAITGVVDAGNHYTGGGFTDTVWFPEFLILASGFAQAANNGLKRIETVSAADITVYEDVVDETPTTDAVIETVGFQFDEADAAIDATTYSYPRLTCTSTANLPLIVGEWIYIGGDATLNQFVEVPANNGFARIRAIGTTYIEFDKTEGTMGDDTGAGAGRYIRIFFGHLIKNENTAALIKRKTYQLERTLGEDDVGTMSEYLVGAVPNEFSFQVRQADKIVADLGFVSIDHEQRNGTTGVKSGTRPDLVETAAFNTSSDFSRIKMHLIEAGETNPDPLFAYLTEMTLTINNNISPNKAIAVLGAFDVSAGQFTVSGNVTAYFADVAAVQAVRNNADVALDFAIVKDNAGWVFDVALITLGDGRLNVEMDQPITLPLTTDAAMGSNNNTLMVNEFPYLPTRAE